MSETINIQQARLNFTSICQQIEDDLKVVVVTRRTEPVVAIVQWDLYKALITTLGVLADGFPGHENLIVELEQRILAAEDEIRRYRQANSDLEVRESEVGNKLPF